MTDEKTVSILDNCYCQCTWSDDGATKLTILTSSKSWSGVINDEALDTVSNKLGGDINKKVRFRKCKVKRTTDRSILH